MLIAAAATLAFSSILVACAKGGNEASLVILGLITVIVCPIMIIGALIAQIVYFKTDNADPATTTLVCSAIHLGTVFLTVIKDLH